MRTSNFILCPYGKKVTNGGQHCEKTLIGCVKHCCYRPENNGQPATVGHKKITHKESHDADEA